MGLFYFLRLQAAACQASAEKISGNFKPGPTGGEYSAAFHLDPNQPLL